MLVNLKSIIFFYGDEITQLANMKTRPVPKIEPIDSTNTKSLINDASPPRLFVLPKHLSPAARICTLPHPRNSGPTRFLFCPEAGLHELKIIPSPRHAKQSWLIGPTMRRQSAARDRRIQEKALTSPEAEDAGDTSRSSQSTTNQGHILKTPELLVATPIDPVFLILPSLLAQTAPKDESSGGRFLSIDDIFESTCEDSRGFRWLMQQPKARSILEERIRAVCDSVSAGDEEMYRLSIPKLLEVLVAKASSVTKVGLPKSMEDHFVSRALERPMLGLKREESSISKLASAVGQELNVADTESFDATTNSTPVEGSLSADSCNTNITLPDQASPSTSPSEFVRLLRLRTCLDYILVAYVTPALVSLLKVRMASNEDPVDFRNLDEELKQIAALRAQAAVSRSLSGLGSKRGLEDDGEAAEARAEKKRKREEEEKRKKAGESHGVRALKKVDTSGMKKMSDFFGKGASSKKAK